MRIATVLNPVSGPDRPILNVLNGVFREHDVDWDVYVTQRDGDAERFARKALSDGADVVGVYGGDGTVSSVASVLAHERTALAILPGGTGNVIAQELGVPLELEAAARLACEAETSTEAVDALRHDGGLGLLRIGAGADARMIWGASREKKDRLGWLAYFEAAVAQVREGEQALYRLTIEDRELELEGLTCIVANIGRIGRGGLSFSRLIDPFDGLLDVLFVRDAGLETLAAVGASLLGLEESVPNREDAPILHFQAREVTIRSEPVVELHRDGEEAGETPITVSIAPAAVRIVLPRGAER